MSVLFPKLSFIVITGYDNEKTKNILPNKNCFAYMHKPYNEVTLVETVSEFLSERVGNTTGIKTEYRPAVYA